MFWFVVLLLVLGGAFYLYSKLKKIEQEILAEQEAEKEARQQELRSQAAAADSKVAEDNKTPQVGSADEEAGEEDSADLAEQLIRAVAQQPGVKQTALYPLFNHVPKRTLQYTLRELTDAGRLKREKIGNSFLLYPA